MMPDGSKVKVKDQTTRTPSAMPGMSCGVLCEGYLALLLGPFSSSLSLPLSGSLWLSHSLMKEVLLGSTP